MSERIDTDTLHVDAMHVVWSRAAGLDVHKMCITAAVRLCEAGRGLARTAVREFSALPDGLRAMTDWLRSHGATAAAMEGTGVYWKAPFEALEDAGIHAELFCTPRPRRRGLHEGLDQHGVDQRTGPCRCPTTMAGLPHTGFAERLHHGTTRIGGAQVGSSRWAGQAVVRF